MVVTERARAMVVAERTRVMIIAERAGAVSFVMRTMTGAGSGDACGTWVLVAAVAAESTVPSGSAVCIESMGEMCTAVSAVIVPESLRM